MTTKQGSKMVELFYTAACPSNATLQASSIYFKTLNKRLCHVVEHVRKCTKIYFVIQEIIFVSLKKRMQ